MPSFSRSTDGGATWSRQTGHVPGSRPVFEVNGTLFTVHFDPVAWKYSLQASIDDGISWVEKVSDWDGIWGPVLGPNGLLWAMDMDGRVQSSADGGTTWTTTGAAPVVWPGGFDEFFGEGGRLYIEGADALLASDDGISWSALTDPGDIKQLVEHGGSLYAVIQRHPHMRSDDGGLSWVVDSPRPQQGAIHSRFFTLGSTLYTHAGFGIYELGSSGWTQVGSTSAGLWGAGGGSLWTNGGRWDPGTWDPTPIENQSAHAPMSSLYGRDNVLIGQDIQGTSFRSDDGGASWQRVARTDLGRMFPLGGSHWFAETGSLVGSFNDGGEFLPYGLAFSMDDGATWQLLAERLRASSFAPVGTDILMARLGGMDRSVNGGFIWTSVQAGMPGYFSHLWLDGSTIYAAGTDVVSDAKRTWRSTDGGVTFTEVADQSFSLGLVRVGGQLVAMANTGAPDYVTDLWHSHDDGVTWQQMHATLPHWDLTTLVSNGSDLFVLELGWKRRPWERFVWHSADAGLTWAQLGSDLPGSVTGIVATSTGLFVAVDGGGVWKWSPAP